MLPCLASVAGRQPLHVLGREQPDLPAAPLRYGALGAAIHRLAAGTALLGGALLTAIALMSVASIVLRSVGMQPIQGDFELVQVGLAICVTLLLP